MRFVAIAALTALAASLCLHAPSVHAQALDKPDPSVSAWREGCRTFVEHPEATGSEATGRCAGAVDALLYVGEVLLEDYRYCVPLRTPRREIVSAILEDLDALRPEVDRQDFKGVVLAILRYRWPCRE